MRFLRTLLLSTLFLLGAGGVCGASQFSAPAVTVTNTTTSKLDLPKGDGLGAVFYVNVTAIGAGDTWTFKLQFIDASGTATDITSATSGITATGKTAFTVASPYSGGTAPFPTHVVATRSVAGGAPTVTYTISGFLTNSAAIDKVKANVIEVCKAGCRYSSIKTALASITDSTTTNRYVVNVGPGIYNEDAVTAVSYTTLRGESSNVSILDNDVGPGTNGILIPIAVTDFTIENMTVIAQAAPIGTVQGEGLPSSRRSIYIRNSIIGEINNVAIDGIIDSEGKTNWYIENTIIRSKFDYMRFTGPDITWYGTGNTYEGNPVAGNPAAVWSVGTDGCGFRIYETGSQMHIVHNSGTIGTPFSVLNVQTTSCADTQSEVVELTGVKIYLTSTFNGTGNPDTTCFKFTSSTTPVTTTPVPKMTLNDVSCFVDQFDSSGTANCLWVANDADFDTWDIDWNGGQCISTASGGGTAHAIRNLRSGATVSLNGVQLTGTNTATGPIVGGDVLYSKASSFLGFPTGDLVAATCTVGEIKADTGGATKELCWCIAGPAWACVSATTATGPTD